MVQFAQTMFSLNKTITSLFVLFVLAMSALAIPTTSFALLQPPAQVDPERVFGTVDEPPGVDYYNSGAPGGIGLLSFITVGVRLVTLVAGMYVFLNLITAGYDYITAGDSKAHQAVKDKVTMSVIGLAIIVASYTVIALISFILFGDASFILTPVITGPTL